MCNRSEEKGRQSTKDYILLNKDKLVRTFKWAAIILTTAFCIWTYYNCGGNCYYSSDFTVGLLMTLLILPTFSIVFEIIPGYSEYWRPERFLDSNPMGELLKNGFKKDVTEKQSKWFLSKLNAVGQFDNYSMICEVENGRLRVIAKTNYDHLDAWNDKDIDSIIQSFRHVKFEYAGEGIAISLKVSDVKRMTYDSLVSYLRDFVRMLKKLKIE